MLLRPAIPLPGSTDEALNAPPIIPWPGASHAASTRCWQGIPSIERTASGRLWASWYTGGRTEDNDNYCLLVTSEDDGQTWTEPVAVIDPPGMTRAWDPCLWRDPAGRLWWTWTQSCPMRGQTWDGRGGIWASIADDPEDQDTPWSKPVRLFHGVALNKPIFLDNGEWLLPMTLWNKFDHFEELTPYRKPGVLVSADRGRTWDWRGGVEMAPEDRTFDEPMIVPRRDGTLWMLIRAPWGIAESFSLDGGISWSRARPSILPGPSSRFHLRRLESGRLLLVNHLGNALRRRTHLTAMLSEDDGATWPYCLLLDERPGVSYPDAIEGPAGELRVIYDCDRYKRKEIAMARVNEDDILAGCVRSAASRLQVLVSQAGGSRDEVLSS